MFSPRRNRICDQHCRRGTHLSIIAQLLGLFRDLGGTGNFVLTIDHEGTRTTCKMPRTRRRAVMSATSMTSMKLTGWSGSLGSAIPTVRIVINLHTENLGQISPVFLVGERSKPRLGSFRLYGQEVLAVTHHSSSNETLKLIRVQSVHHCSLCRSHSEQCGGQVALRFRCRWQ